MITELQSTSPDPGCPLAAIPAERVHAVLRGMAPEDWASLELLLHERLTHPTKAEDIAILEQLFRKAQPIAGHAGGTVFRMLQSIAGDAILSEAVKKAHERMRMRLRFVLREMPQETWVGFKRLIEQTLVEPHLADDLAVLELVFRIGESVSNVEIAALALAARESGRKLLSPEVARKNAQIKSAIRGGEGMDPEAAYQAARRAQEDAEEVRLRAENTLAFRYVQPSAAFKHARNAVFKMVDCILEHQALRTAAEQIESQLTEIKPVTREQMRWALHRMPVGARMEVIKLIPLNTILMFHGSVHAGNSQNLDFKATRDRRLAYDLFLLSKSDEQLMATYGFSFNALKNAVGVILQTLIEKPLARRPVHQYLERFANVAPMDIDQVRRIFKSLNAAQKAEILHALPNCAWKARDAIHMHKHLFLDYVSGEWVLGALVDYYNLEKAKKLTGKFMSEGRLSVRGAQSAITGVLKKIADEPELRQQLRNWATGLNWMPMSETAEPDLAALLPPPAPERKKGMLEVWERAPETALAVCAA